jgi:release factor glutamine methyltransferase
VRPAEVVHRAAGYLERHDVQSPVPTAEALLARVLGLTRTELYTREAGLSSAEARTFGRALCLRCTGTPLQHLTGEQGFRHLVLAVRPGVFVPRPETEVLVDVALAAIAGEIAPRVADACTGTGAIALAIAQEHPGAQVVVTDRSPEAVELARENARALGLDVEVVLGDLLGPVAGPLDLVTCNPPYVPLERRDELPAEVRADPELAVFGGPAIVARLFDEGSTRLRPGGHVVVEIEESTAAAIEGLAAAAGFVDVGTVRDLNGRDRVVTGRRP